MECRRADEIPGPAPAPRRDRTALFERLVDSIDSNPVTLVCAPGGSGKTTLLAQLSSGEVPNFTVLWVSVDEAMARIVSAGEERIAQGGVATVERWIDSIPESIRSYNPATAYLRGTCAWFRWDWVRAKRELTAAVDALTRPDQNVQRVRAIFHLVDALNSSGERAAAMQRLDEASRMQLDVLGEAELALQRAWCFTPTGETELVVRYMREFVERTERDPTTICAATADRIHCMLIGIPGIADTLERFFGAYRQIRGETAAPWHLSALTVGAWAHLWRGRRNEALAALEEADRLQHQFGAVRVVIERLGQLQSLMHVAQRNHSAAMSVMRTRIVAMESAEMAGHGAVWLRPYRYGIARAHWVAENAAGFRELLPYLIAPRAPEEWPFVDMTIEIARAQAAVFENHWEVAEKAFRKALKSHDRYRLPMIHADPRIGLAYVLLKQDKKADAWPAFEPAYLEVISDRALGLLLFEPNTIVDALLEIVPASARKTADHVSLVAEWNRWSKGGATEATPTRGVLGPLSGREYEVLTEVAGGASNKHIARQLSLSLHTVKRHIANILDKLDCDSRGQAADLFRRAAAGGT